jgi:DNA-binding transcriptional LysR family regulator
MHSAYSAGMDPLSQDQLRAFEAVARTASFTRAADELHLSQPALSRRVANLEEHLERTLFVRGPAGAIMTEAGQRLLGFVQSQRALEEELLGELAPSRGDDQGLVRIAGLSSLVPPVILPALAPFLRAHPRVQVEVHSMATEALRALLVQGGADFGLGSDADKHAGLAAEPLGEEEYVVVESRDHRGRDDVFLDSDARDWATDWFFAAQPARLRPKRWRRSYLHDEPGILLGVELGLGRAVKPRHTIPPGAAVRVDQRFTPVAMPVVLMYREQRYYGRLHQAVRALIEDAVRRQLAPATRPRTSRRRAGAG